MINFQNVKIKKRSQPEWLIFYILLLPFLFGALIKLIGFPNAVKYTIDICWVTLLFLAGVNLSRNKVAIEKNSIPAYMWVACFLAFTLILYIFNFQSVFYYLWGFRNNFRLYALFFVCILFLNKQDVDVYLKLFDVLFWINSAVCVIQFFFFDKRWDHLGGLFGVEKGCNGYINIFFVLIVTKSIVYYLNKKESLLSCASKCVVALFIAAMAEIKFFFVEFFVILLLSALITKVSLRKIAVLMVGFTALIVGSVILTTMFPNFSGFLSLDYFIKSASTGGYSGAEQLNRLTTIPIISKEILTTIPQKIFGLGLGNCDTAAYELVRTPFYQTYSYLRYEWFSTSFVFLETGFIGLIFYFGFFGVVAVKSFFMAKKDDESRIYCQIGFIVAIVCVMIAIYNSSLRTEAGYMIYFMLAIPFIAKKDTV